MKKLLIFICVLSSVNLSAQETHTDSIAKKDVNQNNQTAKIEVPDKKEEVFTFVEQMPEYPGGNKEMYTFLAKNFQYPQKEREDNITGTVYVNFIVNKDGNLENVRILRGIAGGEGLDAEALRVVKMMPAWKPGMQNGRLVSVQFNLPIRCTLSTRKSNK